MNLIKRLTEPKLMSDGSTRPPTNDMLAAARKLTELSETINGLSRSLITFQNQTNEDMQRLDAEMVFMKNREKHLEQQLKEANRLLDEYMDIFIDLNLELDSMKPPDMIEFYEINNKDRE